MTLGKVKGFSNEIPPKESKDLFLVLRINWSSESIERKKPLESWPRSR